AFFNNVPETGSGVERPENHPPFVKAPYPDQATKLKSLTAQLASLNTEVKSCLAANSAKAAEWNPETVKLPASLDEGKVARYTLSATPKADIDSVPTPKVFGKLKANDGRSTGAIVTNNNDYLDLGLTDKFDGSHGFSYGCWINPKENYGSPVAKMD